MNTSAKSDQLQRKAGTVHVQVSADTEAETLSAETEVVVPVSVCVQGEPITVTLLAQTDDLLDRAPLEDVQLEGMFLPAQRPLDPAMLQFKGLDHSRSVTFVPAKHFPNVLAPTMTGQQVPARAPVLVEQVRSVEITGIPSRTRSVSAEPSPQYDLSCWLYHQLMSMGLQIRTE